MQFNMLLAGVGGQGILSIAQAISMAAIRRGWNVKQSEVHGMSQRGGSVLAHLRIADHPLYSDLIPHGGADVVLSVEPVEALRYVPFLSEQGFLVSNTAPFVNIPDYPPVEDVLERITKYSRHVLVDANRLARAAGSARATNMVMLGAASHFMDLEDHALDGPISEMFGRKGEKVVDVNLRACRFGRNAAAAYRDGLRQGGAAATVRQWIDELPADALASPEDFAAPLAELVGTGQDLSHAELQATEQTLARVEEDGRTRLHEHEVYGLLELVGAISPPRHLFLRRGDRVSAASLSRFPGDQVVLKIVSPDIVHKTEARAIAFVMKNAETVNREVGCLIAEHQDARIDGVLVVEFVEHAGRGLGCELFVGIRASREFGPVIAAGLGGVDTEYLADMIQGGRSVAKAIAQETDAEQFFTLFQQTAAYEIISGQVRGHHRVVSDGELKRCFRSFLGVARHFCADRGDAGPDLFELEVNPFAFVQQRLVPLDGRGHLASATKRPIGRPVSKIHRLLEPRSIAVLGVSTQRVNFGRIILDHVKACGFPCENITVIKDGHSTMEGVACVANVQALPERVDLLVIATAADDMVRLMEDVANSGKVESVIIIPAGLGETAGSEMRWAQLRETIEASRGNDDGGPIVIGPNCLGVRSRPGHYDTFFIPASKLDPRRNAPARRAALISQSGAFIVTRLSNLPCLDPVLAISFGNQLDATVSDILGVVGARDDVDCVGVYVEGFNDLDGLDFVRTIANLTTQGKVVILYKAGRTEPGRAATAGHTASIAGDYDVCAAAASNAGAIVADTPAEFEQLLELATALHGKSVRGRRIGVISNAGCETVGMADAITGFRHRATLGTLSESTAAKILDILQRHRLESLVNIGNPLDLTPMSNDEVYEECTRAMLADEEIDAVVVSCVPLTPQILSASDEIGQPESLARRLPEIFRQSDKPVVAVIDSGPPFEAFRHALHSEGMPAFRSCDQAVRSVGRYLCHRIDVESY